MSAGTEQSNSIWRPGNETGLKDQYYTNLLYNKWQLL